jgi:hypothetical protein
MSNTLNNQIIAQMYAQESGDPFLALLTIDHEDFVSPIRLVNDMQDVISRGNTFQAFPFRFRLSPDDGESRREVSIDVDNTTLEFMDEFRSTTSPLSVTIEMILASTPDTVVQTYDNLKTAGLTYNKTAVKFTLLADDFLNTKMTSESYDPQNFPGLF